MEQDTKERFLQAGIDVDDAMKRLMNNEALFLRLLGKFAENDAMEKLRGAIASGDSEAALLHSHTLKGVCGNLSMTELYALFSEQVALYRADSASEADALMPAIEAAYRKVLDGIR